MRIKFNLYNKLLFICLETTGNCAQVTPVKQNYSKCVFFPCHFFSAVL